MKKNILVIEDDPSIAEVIKIVLESEGYEVTSDLKGDYFDQVHTNNPHLILVDLLLPGVSGVEIVRTVREKPVHNNVPIIMMSANSPSELEETAQKSGVDAFITKPFNIDDLITLVAQFLS